jgi:hypothetical protein
MTAAEAHTSCNRQMLAILIPRFPYASLHAA